MKKSLYYFLSVLMFFLFPMISFGQTEIVPSVTIGFGGDFTNPPIHGQSEFSHSQTIYYPEQLQFQGTINEIRFNTEFYESSITNSDQWIVKIGTTSISAFSPGDGFLNTSSFLQVFNGTISQDGYDIIITFSQPYYYNGTQNLVLDIQEVSPGATSSALLGFEGEENFGNPPLRTKMTFTSNGSTQGVIENSFAQTHFYGNLEICSIVQTPNINSISQTSTTVDLIPDPDISTYRYNVNLAGQNIPSSYNTTPNQQILLTNLLPASDYFFNVRADCNLLGDYLSVPFTTKPIVMTLPSTIDFDGTNTRNYYPSTEVAAQVDVSNLAGVNGTNGLLFRGAQNPMDGGSWQNYNIWNSNYKYISRTYFLIDLTAGASNPVFSFELRQNAESHFRLEIDGYVQNIEYTSNTPNQDPFKTITIDLSNYIGEIVSLEMQHISQYSGNSTIRSAFVDNVQLKESTCLKPTGISASAGTNSIDLSWNPISGSQWQIRYVNHDENPNGSAISNTTNPSSLNSLATAKPYDIYIRNNCGSTFSAWKKTIQSTAPLLINIPYQEDFSGSLSNYCSPMYNNSSQISFYSGDVVLHQEDKGDEWTGGFNTTEFEAWNDNKDFITGLTFRVDAANLTSLTMNVRFKLSYFFSPETSWFRIKVNGNQIGNSYNPSPTGSYQIEQIDLSAYVGGIVEVQLEHCGRSDEYSNGGMMDAIKVDYVNFTGTNSGVTGINVLPASTTADISWIPAANETEWEIEYGPQGFSPGNGTVLVDNDGTPTTTITALSPTTNYDVYVKAICGPGCSSPQVGPESFTTLFFCPAVSNITISNINANSVDVSWTLGGTETQWEVEYGLTGFAPGTGTTIVDNNTLGESISGLMPNTSYDVYVTAICGNNQSNAEGPVSYTTMPICEPVSTIMLNSLTDVSVGLAWNPVGNETEWKIEYGVSGFTLGSGTVFHDNDGSPDEIISGLAPATAYDFYVIAVCGAGNESLHSGPLSVNTFASCEPVTNILVSNISDISADISWTSNGNEMEWEIEYGLAGFTPGTGTTIVDNNTLGENLLSLMPNTSYDVYITAICSSNQSNPVGPTSFTTLVSCPEVSNISISNIDEVSADIFWTTGGAETQWKIEYGPAGFTIGSGIMVTDNNAIGESLSNLFPNTSYDVYVTAICSNYQSNPVGPASFTTLVSCPEVSNIVLPTITNNEANISWTENGTATEWEIEYGMGGFVPDSGTGTIVTDSDGTPDKVISGLTPSSDYDVYVTAICGNIRSNRVGPVGFSTLKIKNRVFDTFSYYPNPVSKQLSLKAINVIQQVAVFDLLGRKVLESQPNTLTAVMEFSNIQAGTYLMKVVIHNSTMVFRIIKE